MSRATCSKSHTGLLPVCPTDSGGGKNSTNQIRKSSRRKKCLYLATYNIRTMRLEEHLESLEKELRSIKWDVVGISETRIGGEASSILKSGHLLYQKNQEINHHIGGTAIIIHRRIRHLVTKTRAISDRVIYIMIQLNKMHSVQIIQAYAPTSKSPEEECEQFYEDISVAMNSERTKAKIILGDFNAKLGQRNVSDPHNIGNFGLGERNHRGQIMLDFLCRENLYSLNTFFKKPPQRKWTWRSPDGTVKNEIDYILSTNKNTCLDVSVLNHFNTGSDHRLVRAKFSINTQLERKRRIEKSIRPSIVELADKREEYNTIIENKLEPTENLRELSLDDLSTKITSSIQTAKKVVCYRNKNKETKISKETNTLIELRRITDRDSPTYEELNKRVKKEIRKDLRRYNTRQIEKLIGNNMNMKVLKSKGNRGKLLITKLRNGQGNLIYGRNEIAKVIQEFYLDLYKQTVQPPTADTRRHTHPVINVGSEEMPEISISELRTAIGQLKKEKAPGEDGITNEMLKIGGKTLEEAILILLNKCLEEGKTPEAWQNAEVIILFKKGDATNLENYRPISLLSVLYKVLTKVLTNRLNAKFDFYQPVEQAGFRKGFSTIDHIQSVRTLIEKCTEYNIPLHLAFVDYHKAFDSIETWAVLDAMHDARIDSRYTEIIGHVYGNAAMRVKIDDELTTDKIPINRGVRQGDTISPKLFTLALENIFRKLPWLDRGISIDGKHLHHLRFADDIVLISKDSEELSTMIKELQQTSKTVGLTMNIRKTKIMSTDNIDVIIENQPIEVVNEYNYLGHIIKLGKENQTAEINRRTGLAWAAFSRMAYILKNHDVPISLKRKIYNTCILPVATYGLETVTMTHANANKLRVCQRAMERTMLGISLRDRVRNKDIRQRTKVDDVVVRATRLKWRWAGHVARDNNKWTKILMEWRPRESKRNIGRPQARWRDDIQKIAGRNWILAAQDRNRWKMMEEAYIQQWTETG